MPKAPRSTSSGLLDFIGKLESGDAISVVETASRVAEWGNFGGNPKNRIGGNPASTRVYGRNVSDAAPPIRTAARLWVAVCFFREGDEQSAADAFAEQQAHDLRRHLAGRDVAVVVSR
jgi:hypothetical protein